MKNYELLLSELLSKKYNGNLTEKVQVRLSAKHKQALRTIAGDFQKRIKGKKTIHMSDVARVVLIEFIDSIEQERFTDE